MEGELHWEVREATREHDGHEGMVGYYLFADGKQEWGIRVDIHYKGIDKAKNALNQMRDHEDLVLEQFRTIKEAHDAQH